MWKWQKRWIVTGLIFLVFMWWFGFHSDAFGGQVTIGNNDTGAGTSEDTLTVVFWTTDSIANVTDACSLLVMIFEPDGDSAFGKAIDVDADSDCDSIVVSGRTVYSWTHPIATIDGSAEIGTYKGVIVAIDTLDGAGAVYLDQIMSFSLILEPSEAVLNVTVAAADADVFDSTKFSGPIQANMEYIGGTAVVDSAGHIAVSHVVGITTANVTQIDGVAVVDSAGHIAASHVAGGVVDGVNLDDCSGTLANSQIDDDVDVNTKTMTDGVITAAKIADDAIDYATFAATAPTAWWNEGKTGYALSVTPPTAGAIADAVWDEDTTGHYAVGTYGYEAAQSGGSAPSAATIADAVWDEDTTGHYAVGTYGYEAAQRVTYPNLDNATGTLSNAQIDDDVDVNTKTMTDGVITAAKIATSAIDSTKIAANAIGASELAATAVDEIWDELMKTAGGESYSLTARIALGSLFHVVINSTEDSSTNTSTRFRVLYGVGNSYSNKSFVGSIAIFSDTTDGDFTVLGGQARRIIAWEGEYTGWNTFMTIDRPLSADSAGEASADYVPGAGLKFVIMAGAADSLFEGSAASGLDSATTSRIIGRKVWGIAAGSGSDSTALADRNVDLDSAGFPASAKHMIAIHADSGNAAAIDYEQVWYGIDTTNIDTSLLGQWLIANIGGCALTGAYPCSLYVMKIDTNDDTTAVMGAYVRFYEMDSITGVGLAGPSISSGLVLADLGSTDPDSFLAAVWLSGYAPDTARQVIVAQSGGLNDTLYLTEIPATLPDSAGLCRVHGRIYTSFGQVLNNAMVAVGPVNNLAAKAGNKIIVPTEKVVAVDTLGQFEFYLEKSSNVVYPHADSTYHYKISVFLPAGPQSDGSVIWKEVRLQDETGYFTVPDSSSYSIEAILGATYTPE